MHNLIDFIKIYDNVISQELIDEIMLEYEDSEEWKDCLVSNGEGAVLRKDIRDVKEILLSSGDLSDYRKEIDLKLYGCFSNLIQRYSQTVPLFHKDYSLRDSGYCLLKYQDNGKYKKHTDYQGYSPVLSNREISCSIILNDGVSGGEFSFWDKDVIYKIKKGSAIMFPSAFMFPHEILPVTSGTRYSVLTWYA